MAVKGIGQRLKDIRNGQTLAAFSDRLGVHKNTLSRYEKEESFPDAVFIDQFCDEFNISPMWLIQGEGPTYRSDLRFYFLKDEHIGFDFGSKDDEKRFKEVISDVDYYLRSEYYKDSPPDVIAKTYFYLYSKSDKGIGMHDIAEAISVCIEPSFCIYDLDINQKVTSLVEVTEKVLPEGKKELDEISSQLNMARYLLSNDYSKRRRYILNRIAWEIRDFIIDNFCSHQTIAPNRVKKDIFDWIDKSIARGGFDFSLCQKIR